MSSLAALAAASLRQRVVKGSAMDTLNVLLKALQKAESILGRDDWWLRLQTDGSGSIVDMDDNPLVDFETAAQLEEWLKTPILIANTTITMESLAQGRGLTPAAGKAVVGD